MTNPTLRVFVPVLLSMFMSWPLLGEDANGKVEEQAGASGSPNPSAIDESMTAQTPPELAANTLPPAPAPKSTPLRPPPRRRHCR